jgi:hypothetical protein
MKAIAPDELARIVCEKLTDPSDAPPKTAYVVFFDADGLRLASLPVAASPGADGRAHFTASGTYDRPGRPYRYELVGVTGEVLVSRRVGDGITTDAGLLVEGGTLSVSGSVGFGGPR